MDLVLNCVVNGTRIKRLIPAERSLLDFLREDLDLTGSKHGCDVGDCGACTVLIGGEPRLACIMLAAEAEGAAITTIEGIGGKHKVQQCFDKHVASQCGYCTPGIVLNLIALGEEEKHPTETMIRECLGANICRCTGYTKIISAAKEAIEGA
jgi:aerobic-type carbon monoxide dehydrogenase small subunit (CoxS/CutS family)